MLQSWSPAGQAGVSSFSLSCSCRAIAPAFCSICPRAPGPPEANTDALDLLDQARDSVSRGQNEIEPNWGTQEYLLFCFTVSIWKGVPCRGRGRSPFSRKLREISLRNGAGT
jgi:hypothetical protein